MKMSLARSLAMNFSGQLMARVLSFGINMYLLRVVDNDVLGLVNVRFGHHSELHICAIIGILEILCSIA
ncbi:unnamed protein product [Haemonchus placei]|uniref:Protein RFT1 homolog n=1 Tax=Haemonchus placei TaxID=6290 RepID=A0A3P7WEP5_HAEPC|nr:unnamed protein product [Haemonchus placei]